jgi:hypothetical protein
MGEHNVLTKCVLGLKQCSEIKPCPMHAQYKSIKHQLIRLFETKTIQTLANEITNGASFIGNGK